MESINVYEAKTQLSRLLERVEDGEEIVIARAGKPVAKLVPLPERRRRHPGGWAGRWGLAADWDSDSVNESIAELFESTLLGPGERATEP